ncbi:mitochondrial glyco protein [Violaceomyces palustris]|uniref:Mitochondrial glyco protein n=1 Tax=Violaceomyces palustris TaxID=1673888 RepID=A0ACD0NSK6_9BASI|nr:mitochondrial glyco protein [Violaceomyces palustris]
MFASAIRSTAARAGRSARLLQPTSLISARAPLAARSVLATPTAALTRSFNLSSIQRGQGSTDADLSAKLAQEIAYEKENNESYDSTYVPQGETEPEFLIAFKKQGVWKIEDKPGSDEIALTREFGNEHIRVLFSIGDIDTTDPNDLEADIDPESTEEDGQVPSFPVRCAITISKSNKGALTIDAQAQDGDFTIENISFYKDAKLATELTAEADWARRGLYIGPQFETLDEEVQTHFESYLIERGIDSNLALFIPNFGEYKEQKEYCSWLENVKEFVDV